VDMQGLIEGWGEVAPTGAMNPNGFGIDSLGFATLTPTYLALIASTHYPGPSDLRIHLNPPGNAGASLLNDHRVFDRYCTLETIR
ncbi:MAG: hypothetical protein LGR52_07365, partial [Candidatus Thiosymbion ectosymbiont of Robbea hypermnestra]|nr:hypothetical protein [Candidatus Thiosymbion ectosymbiont of Robbea hypermnestra]